MLILIGIATFVSTLLGGLFALRLKDKLHLILGFSAGAVVGVAFFDLMPEAIDLAGKFYSTSLIMTMVALGFATYLILDRFVVLHSHEEENNSQRGVLGAGSLAIHSFLDGIGIGLAFQVSPTVGLIVAIAVLAHDFSDGINTISMILKNGGNRKEAFRWLILDAAAPVLGIFSTMFFTLPQERLGLLLALFSGFFLYIGASDLLPESHHSHPMRWTTIATIIGMGFLYLVIRLSSI